MVATPCFDGHITGIYVNSLLRLQETCLHRRLRLTVKNILGDALITRARQNLLTYFMDEQTATHLLFIDADIGFDPFQVFRLLDFGADCTAAAYPLKNINWPKIAELARAGRADLDTASLDYVLDLDDPDEIRVERGFVRVRSAGTGFLMLRRAAVLRMMEHYADLAYVRDLSGCDSELKASKWRRALFNCMLDKQTGTYMSEDYSFCRRWTDIGGEIWLDIRSNLVHAGTAYFHGDLSTQFRDVHKAKREPGNSQG